jgi:proline iminopeptidase
VRRSRRPEIDWFLYGMRWFFPDVWRRFAEAVPEAERGDLLAAYHRRLTDPDPGVHLPAARAWSTYEGACSTLLPSPETVAAFGEDGMALGTTSTTTSSSRTASSCATSTASGASRA